MRHTLLCTMFLLALTGCGNGLDPALDGVEIRGGTDEHAFADMIVEGHGLRNFNRCSVHVRIGGPTSALYPRERTGYGKAEIVRGVFRLKFPAVREVNFYKPFALFVDVDANGRCSPGRDMGLTGATLVIPDPDFRSVDAWEFLTVDAETCRFMEAAWMD